MNCAFHANLENIAYCIRCGRALCKDCVRNVRDRVYCEECLAKAVETEAPGSSAPPKKTATIGGTSPSAAFVLGLIPGVGAIYNGEYFKAAVHILIFGLLSSIAHTGGVVDHLFGFFTFGFYVYMPFEAYYTAKKRALAAQGVELETPFDRFNEQLGRIENKDMWGGFILVLLGCLFLLDNFDILRMDRLMRFWPVVLIAIGVWLLKRFKERTA